MGGIAALGEEEAMYFHSNLDAVDERLTGASRYRWRRGSGRLFLVAHHVHGHAWRRYFFVETPINRYSIGDRTPGLVLEPDESLEIVIQHEHPGDAQVANRLPALEWPMRLALRAYGRVKSCGAALGACRRSAA